MTPARAGFETFERDDGTEVMVEFTISPYDPGVLSGPPERCYPPEGGEVEIIAVRSDAGLIDPTDAEIEKWSNWIVENRLFDDGSCDD